MAIVDWSYYSTEYLGKTAQSAFAQLEARAEEAVNFYTNFRIEKDWETLTPIQQKCVKKAICSQVDYYSTFGINVGTAGDTGGWTVGKVSVSNGGADNAPFLDFRTRQWLETAGLVVRRVGVLV